MIIDNLINNPNLINNSLIIAPFSYRRFLLDFRNKNPEINFDILDKNEFLQRLYYLFDKNSVNKIIKLYPDKYNVIEDISSKLINIKNIVKSEDKNRILDVIKLRDYLVKINLATEDEYFSIYLKNKKIYVLGYPLDDADFAYIKEKKSIEFENIELNYKNIVPKKYYKFEGIFDELHFVFNEMSRLINEENVDCNDILLVGINDDYKFYLNYFSEIYKIPINSNLYVNKLFSFPIIRDFIEYFELNEYQISKDIFLKDNPENNELKLFFEYISYFEDLPKDKLLPLIKLISKSKTNKVEKYKTAVKVYEGGLPLKTDHVFILNFCEGQFPKVHKEDSYFDDDFMKIIFSTTSSSLNSYEESLAKYILTNCNVEAISTIENRNDTTCFISSLKSLLRDENNNEIEPLNLYKPGFEYSKDYLNLRYGLVRDYYHLYDKKLFDFEFLNNKYIDKTLIDNSVSGLNVFNSNSPLSLSYSSIKKYKNCPYSYYLDKVLKIEEINSDDFALKLGTLFHSLIELFTKDGNKDYISIMKNTSSFSFKEWIKNEIKYDDLESFDDDYNYYLNVALNGSKKYPSIKPVQFEGIHKIFLNKHLEHFKLTLKYILYKYSNMSLKLPINPEKSFEYKLDNISLINGKVDAYLLTESDGQYWISIIDYKTSDNNKFFPDKYENPDDIQLLTYLLFSRKDNSLMKYKFLGAYFLHALSKKNLIKADYSNLDQALSTIKLVGFTYMKEAPQNLNDKEGLIERVNSATHLYGVDTNWKNGEFILNISVNKDGDLGKKSIVYSDDELDNLCNVIIDIYKKSFNDIRNNVFDIKPKDNNSCQYCGYKHICYVNDSQKNNEIEEENNND